MAEVEERRAELAAFLRARREDLVRADFALPPAGRGRLRGLRREEIAYLSGVSVTWYTWLEQARPIKPSRQVLEAVIHAMRLTGAEAGYVLALAGFAALPPAEAAPVEAAPAHIQHLLDALDPHPAFALAPDWGIAGWNRAYEHLNPNVASVEPHERNLLWLVFTDPYVRDLLPDWQVTSARFLAEFRADAGARLGDPATVGLVARLRDASAEFRAGWDSHTVGGFASRERQFQHPVDGLLTFEHHQLQPSDRPDLRIVAYLPITGS